jgi:putative N6-adenine-specific DNA methylase
VSVDLFVTALRGTELALRDELRELGLRGAVADRGGARVPCAGGDELEVALRLCLWTRVGVRVLVPVGDFAAPDPEALYAGVRGIAWERWLDETTTLAVSCVSRESALHHTNFVSLKTKDAIVDRLRDRLGARPSVDRDDPAAPVFVHLKRDHAKVFLDASGDSLHRRGYRLAHGEAPLKETLAAAVLRLSGWDRKSPLVDPTCGSGTIAIEADLWARRVAPGLARPRFALERWRSMDEPLRARFRELREEARAAALSEGPEVLGTDSDRRVVEAAGANASRIASRARFSVARLGALRATEPPGTVVANLPYGERIAVDPGLFDELSEAMRRARSMRFALLLGGPPPEGALPVPDALHPLWNGPIECRLALIEAF